MQLLLVSDLHYTLPQFDWVLDRAADFDVVVVAGDSLDVASAVALESQIVVIRTYLAELGERTRVVVCSGNHDLTARNEHGEKHAPWVAATDGDRVHGDWGSLDVDECHITVCPWWDGPLTRADVDRQLVTSSAIGPDRRAVWVYHFPPDESPVSWIGQRHIGDRDLNAWIERHRPDLVLTGHIHDSPFKPGGSWIDRVGTTWVINAGHATGPIPAHVIVDTVAGTAEWWSPFGHGTEDLWPAQQPVAGQ